ncbi:MAG: hypothetical protein SangKO_051360 [Sandaracinaceae bacterium]
MSSAVTGSGVTESEARRRAVVRGVSRALGRAERASDCLVPVLEALGHALDARRADVLLADLAATQLTPLVSWPDTARTPRAVHVGDGLAGRAAETGRALAEGGCVAVPVSMGASVVAVIHAELGDLDDLVELDEPLLAVLEAVGAQVGHALRSVELSHLASLAELRRSGVVASSPDPIVALDHRGKVVEWNGAAERVLGWSAHEVLGEGPAPLFTPPRWRARASRVLRSALSADPRWMGRALPLTARRADGTELAMEVTLALAHSPRGVGVVIYLRDVSAARRDRQALQKARRLAEDESRRRDDFLALLGHELRNPLSPIVAAAELLDGYDDPILQRTRGVIARQSRQLVRLVDDLLDVSRAARGKLALDIGPRRLGDMLDVALEMTRAQIAERGHHLTLDVDAGVWVHADFARGSQIFANLLSNAARYTDEGGRIWVRARPDADHALVEVRDDGRGMSRALLERAFEPFSQGEGRSRGGLGLGLALVSHLVRLHGGSVGATSPGEGLGTTISVRLPLALAAAAEPPPAGARATGSERSILIVDDHVDSAELLSMALSSRGHHVRIAPDAETALELVAHARPEVALVDIGLPGMDGHAFALQLRERWPDHAIRMIALTGYGAPADRSRSAEVGFAEHLVKPVRVADVEDALAAR